MAAALPWALLVSADCSLPAWGGARSPAAPGIRFRPVGLFLPFPVTYVVVRRAVRVRGVSGHSAVVGAVHPMAFLLYSSTAFLSKSVKGVDFSGFFIWCVPLETAKR